MSQNSAHRVDILLCKLSAEVVKASFAYKPVVSPRAEAGKVDALAQRLNTPLRKLKTKPVGEKRLHLGQNSVGLCLVTNDENHVVHITDIALDLKNALDVVVKTVKIDHPKQLTQQASYVEADFAVSGKQHDKINDPRIGNCALD